jgi:glycosyltransferase involved in cell wall biosynthesis
MKVAIVTPTIGTDFLYKCLDSVQNQTYKDLIHYVFIDGGAHTELVEDTIFQIKRRPNYKKIETISLSDNIGKGWYGHRVYAASSFLVNADIICYLDEDNWFDPDHVEFLVNKIKKGNDWAYSLRKIYNREGEYQCEDNCESLGMWPVYFDPSINHIDTSSFAIRRDVAVSIGHAWYGQWGADRQFYGALKQYYPKYECTNKYSLCYRLDGNPNSVNKEFFENGNKINFKKYNGEYPWRLNGKKTR